MPLSLKDKNETLILPQNQRIKVFKLVNNIFKINRKERFIMQNILNSLNTFLSDLNVFYRKLQNYHWNVKGKDFFVVHGKLEEYYNNVNEQIDEIAEHILSLGGQPLGTLRDYLDTTKLAEAENKKVDSTVVFTEITKDFTTLLEEVTNIKKMADNETQYKTSALMDEIIENYTKTLWMLKQSAE